jgi:hypothetical protein
VLFTVSKRNMQDSEIQAKQQDKDVTHVFSLVLPDSKLDISVAF